MQIKLDVDRFMRQINSYAEHKKRQIEAGLTRACITVQESAMEKCPKDSDALRQSIGYKIQKNGARSEGIVGSGLEYAPYVHEGTGIHSRTGRGRKDVPWSYMDEEGNYHSTDGMEPRPFLEEARNECRDRIVQIMYKTLKG